MNKAAGAVIMAAVGTAAVMTYASMKPRAKNQLKKEFRDTFHHMDDVKGYYELQQKSFVESGDCEETPVDNYVLFDVMEEACAE